MIRSPAPQNTRGISQWKGCCTPGFCSRDDRTIAETRSDPYGDFKFQGLEEGSGRYRVEISAERYADRTVEFDLKASVYLGTIVLDAGRAVA